MDGTQSGIGVDALLLAFGAAFGHFEHVGHGYDVMHEAVRWCISMVCAYATRLCG